MSLLHRTEVYDTQKPKDDAGRKPGVYGFILVLVCVGLVLVLAGALGAPATIGSGIDNATLLIGP
jgi:hypothetical protein